ncbi:autophagy-related protein 27 [Zalerion maritima]|uniref:Autophagy-related protein 27 n=1 Tax=Zalerion maritima TaxID=339359 RepID=A0AAD5WQ33_9PEZI|nr:autophagy-related protein 27 [Zalerion maritima]
MRPFSLDHAGLVAVVLGALFSMPEAYTYDCSKIRADKHTFDLSGLRGPHSVSTTKFHPPRWYNTTYTIDICAPLKHAGKSRDGEACPQNTRVCGIEHEWKSNDEPDEITGVYPIAGELRPHGGYDMDAKMTRLSTSESTGDSKREGLRMVLHGGAYPLGSKHRLRHKAIIEFLCDPDRDGLEGEWDPEEKYDPEGDKDAMMRLFAREDDDEDEDGGGDDDTGDGEVPNADETQFKYENTSLLFDSFREEGSSPTEKVLRLTWYTKHACENRSVADPEGDRSRHWGAFTWIVVIAFLAIASYLIFGSWLNYSRYGARGWDLLPHGDTIRDIPYLLRDWARQMLSTVQGGGSRGGYSAV